MMEIGSITRNLEKVKEKYKNLRLKFNFFNSGQYFLANGDRYYGDWRNDNRTGKGKIKTH